MSPSLRHRRTAQGFTLVELMIVMVIIGTLSTIGLMMIKPGGANIDIAKNLLYSKAFEMRQRAISNTTAAMIRITPGASTFDADADISDGVASTKTIQLPENIVVSRSDGSSAIFTVTFQDNGMVTTASVGGIVITDTDSTRSYTLTINRIGSMKIE